MAKRTKTKTRTRKPARTRTPKRSSTTSSTASRTKTKTRTRSRKSPVTSAMSDFRRVMHERGFVHQETDPDGLDRALREKKPVTGYIGFDATADSLHVGSL